MNATTNETSEVERLRTELARVYRMAQSAADVGYAQGYCEACEQTLSQVIAVLWLLRSITHAANEEAAAAFAKVDEP